MLEKKYLEIVIKVDSEGNFFYEAFYEDGLDDDGKKIYNVDVLTQEEYNNLPVECVQ